MITVYEKPTCTTCKNLVKLLGEQGIDFESIEYQVIGLTEEDIRSIMEKSGLGAADLLRMRESGAKELAGEDEYSIVDAMVKRPELMQRPVVVNGDRAVLARPIDKVLEIL